ncbi:leucine-rich PPR motif-containing protein, mitochondrial [Eupeodes corollae]|uniref:leucine-rich PPR motif-containing protein, mitochondrial n=1 Tax=Eupeodes corollae TaxID=290404 RepID=UPI0024917925|nr:leucine-rich PPR motif-containing protein, mitochondrial [Eupeodes corollae]
MASILRSGKLFRYFAGLTRSVVFQSVRETEGSLVQNSQCVCSNLINGYATTAAKTDLSLDKQLKRLDSDVRRTGRIARRDIEEVLDEIRHQRSATSSQSLLVIRCCGNLVPEELPEVRTALVQEIWNTLNSLNVPMDISHYNALLRVYLENEHPFSPAEFLSELESKAIEPNRVTYQRLVLRYCQQGDIDGATRILEYMREKNLPVNESVFNALILGHSQANDIESAKSILTVMKQAGLEPSADTFTTLLCCYARHGDVDAILQTIEECEKNEIFLLDKDILDAVYALAINGHEAKVDQVLGKLKKFTGFNQEAVNVILRLVNKGYEDVGLKVLRIMPRSTRPDGQLVDVGTFFIRQLVKVNRPIEKILSVCKQLQEEGLNPKALLIATEAGLVNGANHATLPLLKELKNSGQPIRQHYFWPLFCSAEPNEVIDIVEKMQNEFSVQPNSETVREYVIPKLSEKRLDRIVSILTNAGVSNGTAASSAAHSALLQNKIEEAAKLVESYRAYYAPALFRYPLIQALSKTDDYKSFTRIVRQIHDNLSKDNVLTANHEEIASEEVIDEGAAKPTEEATPSDPETVVQKARPAFIGQVVSDAANFFRNNRVEHLENILTHFVEQGLSMTSEAATKIQERVGSEMTPKISELLTKMTSGELEPLQLNVSSSRKRTLDKLSIDELERFIANQEAKGENTNTIKRQLLITCFKSKNLEKTVEVINRLESDKFTIPTGTWAQLIDLYAQNDRLEDALKLYEKLKAKEPAFLLDNLKSLRIAEMMMKSEKIDDAVAFLQKNKKDEYFNENEGSFMYSASCWRLLNQLAESGNVEKTELLFDTLVKNNYIVPTNVLLGPLIKVHLVRDDIQKAMEKFEQITTNYKSTPWKNELACRLIQKEDAANLQKLTDLSTSIHGEVNSLYDLVLSFVECGRIRQARKILETPGLRTRPKRIDFACERYRNEGMVESLEGLIEATKDLQHIDRNTIFYNLLLSYSKNEEAEKALGLWTKMQEESITPSDEFLTKLAQLLKSKNMEVPFVVPQASQKEAPVASEKRSSAPVGRTAAEVKPQKTGASARPTSSALNEFRSALASPDVDRAIELKNKLNLGQSPSAGDISQLIENLIHAQRLIEATKYVFELLDQGRRPIPKVFKFYLNKIAATGDLETMKKIGEKLTSEQKKIVSFDNRYCHANIASGKCEPYLNNLLQKISTANTPEEISAAADKFPRGGSLGILETCPELLPKFEELAKAYADKKHVAPMNVLWVYHSIHKNEAPAKEIWEKYLVHEPRLMFQRILQIARQNNDEKQAEDLINQLKSSKITGGAVGNAYSCLLDIQCAKSEFDKGLETLNTALKSGPIDHINRTALIRLKEGLEASGKKFPHTIPDKKIEKSSDPVSSSSSESSGSSSSDSDSTSSSDEDVKIGPNKP